MRALEKPRLGGRGPGKGRRCVLQPGRQADPPPSSTSLQGPRATPRVCLHLCSPRGARELSLHHAEASQWFLLPTTKPPAPGKGCRLRPGRPDLPPSPYSAPESRLGLAPCRRGSTPRPTRATALCSRLAAGWAPGALPTPLLLASKTWKENPTGGPPPTAGKGKIGPSVVWPGSPECLSHGIDNKDPEAPNGSAWLAKGGSRGEAGASFQKEGRARLDCGHPGHPPRALEPESPNFTLPPNTASAFTHSFLQPALAHLHLCPEKVRTRPQLSLAATPTLTPTLSWNTGVFVCAFNELDST